VFLRVSKICLHIVAPTRSQGAHVRHRARKFSVGTSVVEAGEMQIRTGMSRRLTSRKGVLQFWMVEKRRGTEWKNNTL
jgi:hypothetical protein